MALGLNSCGSREFPPTEPTTPNATENESKEPTPAEPNLHHITCDFVERLAAGEHEMARPLDVPLPFFHGERDYQVTETDSDLWRDALVDESNVRFKTYPDLNHLFIPCGGAGFAR